MRAVRARLRWLGLGGLAGGFAVWWVGLAWGIGGGEGAAAGPRSESVCRYVSARGCGSAMWVVKARERRMRRSAARRAVRRGGRAESGRRWGWEGCRGEGEMGRRGRGDCGESR